MTRAGFPTKRRKQLFLITSFKISIKLAKQTHIDQDAVWRLIFPCKVDTAQFPNMNIVRKFTSALFIKIIIQRENNSRQM
jgi:hypothetical protein